MARCLAGRAEDGVSVRQNLSRGQAYRSTILVKGLRSRDDPTTTISEVGLFTGVVAVDALIAFMRKAGDVPELMVANPNWRRRALAGGWDTDGGIFIVGPTTMTKPMLLPGRRTAHGSRTISNQLEPRICGR
ncbi:MAG: hypothetical protein IPK98_19575 [Chloracidobacterium sp.]|nr:hypothetical protein [Chloracidobacterium sp.]